MVSDEMKSLLDEEYKRKEILQAKPDTEWAKVDLEEIQSKIRALKKKEKSKDD